MLKIKSNLRKMATIVACLVVTSTIGNDLVAKEKKSRTDLPVFIGVGIKSLSVKPLNDALKNKGLSEINPNPFFFQFGYTPKSETFVHNIKFHFFSPTSEKGENRTQFLGGGFSFDFGYKILKNDKMYLYPYLGLSYMAYTFETVQKSDAKSFEELYNQLLVNRRFENYGGLDAALGLSYRINIGKISMLEIGGGYQLPLLMSKWRYFNNKMEFPKTDAKGWIIGLNLIVF